MSQSNGSADQRTGISSLESLLATHQVLEGSGGGGALAPLMLLQYARAAVSRGLVREAMPILFRALVSAPSTHHVCLNHQLVR